MSVLKVKHVTAAAVWAPVAPLPVIPTLQSLEKGDADSFICPTSAKYCHKLGVEFAGQKHQGPPKFTLKVRVQPTKKKRLELAHVPCPAIFSCSTASAFPGSGVKRAAGVQVCSRDNANIASVGKTLLKLTLLQADCSALSRVS